MAAQQVRVLAGPASALAAVMLGPAGCVPGGQLAAGTVGPASSRTAARAGTAVRLATPLLESAGPEAPGRAQRAGGAPAASLVVLCGPVAVHCPRGFRAICPRARSGRRPRVLLPYRGACIARVPPGSLPPEPRRTPAPYRTPPLRTMPP